MSAVTRRTRRVLPSALLGALLALVLLPLLAAAPASAARTITISLTADGPKPASTTAAVGDTIVFRNDDATFVHQARNKSTNWTFNTGPLAPGQAFTVPAKLSKPDTYVYEGANLDTFTGKVVVPSSTATSAAPAPSKTAGPAPSRSAAASPAASPAAGSPSPTGGTGVVGPPPLAGGFGSVNISPPPGAAGIPPAVAPDVAPTLAGEEVASPQPSGETVAIGSGRLPEPPTGRRYGLPAALAAVAAAGVASLLIRLLLAHPAARRSRPDLPVTVD